MTRQIRLGFTLVLTIVLAVIGFSYFLNGSWWTSRASQPRQTAPISRPVEKWSSGFTSSTSNSPPGELSGSHIRIARPVAGHQAGAKSVPSAIHSHSITVRVRPGESLWSIAKSHRSTVFDLERTNHLTNSLLKVGQVIIVPTPSSNTAPDPATKVLTPTSASQPITIYQVNPGDTLWRISTVYGVTVRNLLAENHLTSDVLHNGQTLYIEANRAAYHPTRASEEMIAAAPDSLISVYQAAGRRYHVPWTVLAAIHKEETDFDTSGTPVSYAGAEGPMQFMPSTFAIYGVPAPGHHYANIHNVEDAIYSTAHMLEATGFTSDPYHAIYEYNHSVSYVDDILRMASV